MLAWQRMSQPQHSPLSAGPSPSGLWTSRSRRMRSASLCCLQVAKRTSDAGRRVIYCSESNHWVLFDRFSCARIKIYLHNALWKSAEAGGLRRLHPGLGNFSYLYPPLPPPKPPSAQANFFVLRGISTPPGRSVSRCGQRAGTRGDVGPPTPHLPPTHCLVEPLHEFILL